MRNTLLLLLIFLTLASCSDYDPKGFFRKLVIQTIPSSVTDIEAHDLEGFGTEIYIRFKIAPDDLKRLLETEYFPVTTLPEESSAWEWWKVESGDSLYQWRNSSDPTANKYIIRKPDGTILFLYLKQE